MSESDTERSDNPYENLAKAILYTAIKNQEPKFVVSQFGREKSITREEAAAEAKEFVGSNQFVHMCGLLGLDPHELRTISPTEAKKKLHKIMSSRLGRKTIGEKQRDSISA